MKKVLLIITSLTMILLFLGCTSQEEEELNEFGLLQRSNDIMGSADSLHINFSRDMFISAFGFGTNVDMEGVAYIQKPNRRDVYIRTEISADFMETTHQSTAYFRNNHLYVIDHTTENIYQSQISQDEFLNDFSSNLIDTEIDEEEVLTSSFENLDEDGFRLRFELNDAAIVRTLALQGEEIDTTAMRNGQFRLTVYLDEDYQQTHVFLHITLTHLRPQNNSFETVELTIEMEIVSINDVVIEFPDDFN